MERAERCLFLPDLAATQALAARVAIRLAPGNVILLEGDLGAGKSEFARAVIHALAGERINVPSPTFTLLQSYALPSLEVGHADLYRIEDPGELVEIGLEECWRHGALLVEWPERAPWLWPAEHLTITLSPVPDRGVQARRARVFATGRWVAELPSLVAGLAPV